MRSCGNYKFFLLFRLPPRSARFPYTTLFRSLPTALRECRGPPAWGLGPTLIAEGPSAEARRDPPVVEATAPTDPADQAIPDARQTRTLPELTRRHRSS